ncbi:MAG: rubrerythrin family protein [Nanoarchaeota archaeon]|nr:rubrerythrin family protein [Nanoarchaeota archaeon]
MKKTKEVLEKAFAGESQARNKYDFFAKQARKDGYEKIAEFFEETARNEQQHAKEFFKLLKGISSTKENLKEGVKGETYEYEKLYPEFAKICEGEGNKEVAELFRKIAEVEKTHAERYQRLLDNVQKGTVFKKSEKKTWRCKKCGYIHEGKEALEKCPLCKHPKSYFEIVCDEI